MAEEQGQRPNIMQKPELINMLADEIEHRNGDAWDQRCQAAWIAKVAAELMELPVSDERIQWLHKELGKRGMGGNASQTRQWGQKERGWKKADAIVANLLS